MLKKSGRWALPNDVTELVERCSRKPEKLFGAVCVHVEKDSASKSIDYDGCKGMQRRRSCKMTATRETSSRLSRCILVKLLTQSTAKLGACACVRAW